MTSSTMPMPWNSLFVIHKTSMATSSTFARVRTLRVNGNAREDITSSSPSTPVSSRDGQASCFPSAHLRKPWATRTSSSCRSAASTLSDSSARSLSMTLSSTQRSSGHFRALKEPILRVNLRDSSRCHPVRHMTDWASPLTLSPRVLLRRIESNLKTRSLSSRSTSRRPTHSSRNYKPISPSTWPTSRPPSSLTTD